MGHHHSRHHSRHHYSSRRKRQQRLEEEKKQKRRLEEVKRLEEEKKKLDEVKKRQYVAQKMKEYYQKMNEPKIEQVVEMTPPAILDVKNTVNEYCEQKLITEMSFNSPDISENVINFLIDAKANINDDGSIMTISKDIINTKLNGWTALMSACCEPCRSLDVVNLLINSGVDVNAINNEGGTALMCATCFVGRGPTVETVRALIDAKADVNYETICPDSGCTDSALVSVLQFGDFGGQQSKHDTIKLLLENGAKIPHDIEDECLPLINQIRREIADQKKNE